MTNKQKVIIFNAVTHGNIITEKMIFSDRAFLTEQILIERELYGSNGFNRISDLYFLHICFVGRKATDYIMSMLKKVEEKYDKRRNEQSFSFV